MESEVVLDKAETTEQWKPRKGVAWAARGLLAAMVAIPVAGGFLGAHQENYDNAGDRETAQAYERCIDVVNANIQAGQEVASVRLSSLSPSEQSDCGVDGLNGEIGEFKDSFSANNLPLDSKLMAVDPIVQLPSEQALREKIPQLENNSANFNNTLVYEGIAGGILADVALVMGVGVGLAFYDQRKRGMI